MIKVTHDLFDIAERLKSIDPRYKVFYNNERSRFEVHTSGLEFIVPFDVLDERTLFHAMRTRRENQEELEQEIQSHNRELDERAFNEMRKAVSQLTDMFDYSHRTSHDVTFSKAKEWI